MRGLGLSQRNVRLEESKPEGAVSPDIAQLNAEYAVMRRSGMLHAAPEERS